MLLNFIQLKAYKTRLPPNLRLTTRKCVYLVKYHKPLRLICYMSGLEGFQVQKWHTEFPISDWMGSLGGWITWTELCEYVWSLPVIWEKKQSHHVICRIQKPHVHIAANLTALHFIEVEFLPIKVLHCENTDFSPFAPVTLTLSRWPSYVNLTHIPWIYWMCKYELPMSGLPKVIVTILTDTSEIIYHTASWVVNKPSVIYQQNKLQLVNLKC